MLDQIDLIEAVLRCTRRNRLEMLPLYGLYITLLFFAILICLALAAYAWQRRRTPGAMAFTGLMVAIAIWLFALAMMAFTKSPEAADFWGRRVRVIGIANAPALLLVFVLQYTGRQEWLSWPRLALLSTIPLITLILTWSGEAHYLFIHWSTEKVGPFTFLAEITHRGPWNGVYLIYSFSTAFLSLLLLTICAIRTRFPYRGQAILLSAGCLIALLANIPDSFLMAGPRPSYAPFGFVVLGLIYAWALFRYRLFDLVPVARDLVVESMADAVLVLDEQHRLVDVNLAAQALMGQTASELIGQPIADLLPAWSDLGEHPDHVMHTEIVMGEGDESRHLALREQPICDHGEQLVGCLVTLRDITENRQAQKAWERSEARYRVLFEQANDGILLATESGQIVDANCCYCELLGYTREELMGMSVADLWPPEQRRTPHVRLYEEVAQHANTPFESVDLHRDGRRIPVEVTLTLLEAEPQNLGLAIVRDVTERKRVEQEMRENEEKYRLVVENLQEGVWAIDAENRTTFVNQRMAEMLGYSEEEMLGRHLFDFMDERGIQVAEQNLERRRSGIQERHDFEFLRRDGTRIYTTLETTPITDDQGNYQGALAGVMDISDRRRAEEALQRRAEELAILNRIAHIVATLTDLPQALQAVAELMACQFAAAVSAIVMWGSGQMEILAWFDGDQGDSDMVGRSLPMPSVSAIREPLNRGETISFPDIQAMPLPPELDDLFRTRNLHALLSAPLRVRGNAFGSLTVATDQAGRAFSPEEISLVETIATDVAVAIENARLFEQAQELAVSRERQRLARDLHDSVTQTLYSVALTAEAMPRVWEKHPDQAQAALSDLHRLARGALGEMRSLLFELQPAMLLEKDLADLLSQLGHAAMGRTQTTVETRVHGARPVPDDMRIAFYRIAQEALNNVARHAAASHVTLDLMLESEQVTLCIKDDGRGFDPETVLQPGFGVRNMTNRAKDIGAQFHLESRPGQGTKINVVWQPKNERVDKA